jgi:hypothetical protein
MLRKEKIITRMLIGSLVALSTFVTSLGPVYAATVGNSDPNSNSLLTISISRPGDGSSTVAAVQGTITGPDGRNGTIPCTPVALGQEAQIGGPYDLSTGNNKVHVHLDKYADNGCTNNLNQPIDMDLTQPGAAVFTMLVY